MKIRGYEFPSIHSLHVRAGTDEDNLRQGEYLIDVDYKDGDIHQDLMVAVRDSVFRLQCNCDDDEDNMSCRSHVERLIESGADAVGFWYMMAEGVINIPNLIPGVKNCSARVVIKSDENNENRTAWFGEEYLGPFPETAGIKYLRRLITQYFVDRAVPPEGDSRTTMQCRLCKTSVRNRYDKDLFDEVALIFVEGVCITCARNLESSRREAIEKARIEREAMEALLDVVPDVHAYSPGGYIPAPSSNTYPSAPSPEGIQKIRQALKERAAVTPAVTPSNPVPGGIVDAWDKPEGDAQDQALNAQIAYSATPSAYDEARVRETLRRLGMNNG